jgi:hypothetical protein
MLEDGGSELTRHPTLGFDGPLPPVLEMFDEWAGKIRRSREVQGIDTGRQLPQTTSAQ